MAARIQTVHVRLPDLVLFDILSTKNMTEMLRRLVAGVRRVQAVTES
jgi:hypothetical protein